MENKKTDSPSFKSWFFSTQEMVEKTVGLIVLIIELYAILQEVFQTEHRGLLTHILNFLFLIFIYFYLRTYFARRFSVDVDDVELAKILGISPASGRKEKMSVLVFHANTFISQLKNINYFVLATAGLYALFLSQFVMEALVKHYGWNIENEIKYGFHLLINLFSYAGAFFLLRCFYVMYLPTIDKKGNSILNKKTSIYLLAGAALMMFDVCIMTKWYGLFVSGFICGLVNAVIFVLLVARFENKILDIPPIILAILYLYAILQTCLPFVTGDIFGANILVATQQLERGFLHSPPSSLSPDIASLIENLLRQKVLFEKLEGTFTTVVLTFCLVGKITLSAVLLYILNTKRIFYYFMTLKRRFEQEDKNWGKFFPKIETFPIEPDVFSVIYQLNPDATYTARMPGLFDDISGIGPTPDRAREELVNEIKGAENNS